jgi:hypothetical protein
MPVPASLRLHDLDDWQLPENFHLCMLTTWHCCLHSTLCEQRTRYDFKSAYLLKCNKLLMLQLSISNKAVKFSVSSKLLMLVVCRLFTHAGVCRALCRRSDRMRTDCCFRFIRRGRRRVAADCFIYVTFWSHCIRRIVFHGVQPNGLLALIIEYVNSCIGRLLLQTCAPHRVMFIVW